jgi:hypothetical protein
VLRREEALHLSGAAKVLRHHLDERKRVERFDRGIPLLPTSC